MAGLGSRFINVGYTCPKYEIVVSGKTLFRRSIESLDNFISSGAKVFFITLKKNNASKFIEMECAAIGLKNFSIIELENLTRGQAESAYIASEWFDDNGDLLIFNIDTQINSKELRRVDIPIDVDGWIPCFDAPGDHWSFVRLGSSGFSELVSEKVRISNNASVGLYWFSSTKLFRDAFENTYLNSINPASEMYVAPLYNFIICNGSNVAIKVLSSDAVHVLGTPEEVSRFMRINEKKS